MKGRAFRDNIMEIPKERLKSVASVYNEINGDTEVDPLTFGYLASLNDVLSSMQEDCIGDFCHQNGQMVRLPPGMPESRQRMETHSNDGSIHSQRIHSCEGNMMLINGFPGEGLAARTACLRVNTDMNGSLDKEKEHEQWRRSFHKDVTWNSFSDHQRGLVHDRDGADGLYLCKNTLNERNHLVYCQLNRS